MPYSYASTLFSLELSAKLEDNTRFMQLNVQGLIDFPDDQGNAKPDRYTSASSTSSFVSLKNSVNCADTLSSAITGVAAVTYCLRKTVYVHDI